MKVGYVVKRYPRYSETFVVNEILAHEAAGQEIEIFSLRFPEDGRFQDAISRVRATVNYLPYARLRADELWEVFKDTDRVIPDFWVKLEAARGVETREIYQAVLLAREIHAKGIQHLHAHFGNTAATVARLAAHLAEIPYTFTAHAKDIFHESVRPEDLSRKLEDAASVITVSDYNLHFLREHYGEAASRVKRVYNGLDLEWFGYQAPEARPPRITAVGRLIEKKGFADLIEACAILAGRRYDFACRIIGTGPLEDQLRDRISRLELEDYVELVGPRPQREVMGYIRDAAVLALPCVHGSDGDRDGLPTVLLEAMALGTPCVSTGVTGIPEVVRHEETGLMVPQHDPSALAAALERLLDDGALRVWIADNARRLMEGEFDIHRNSALLREVFRAANEAYCEASRRVS